MADKYTFPIDNSKIDNKTKFEDSQTNKNSLFAGYGNDEKFVGNFDNPISQLGSIPVGWGSLGLGGQGPRPWRSDKDSKDVAVEDFRLGGVSKSNELYRLDKSELFGRPVHNRVILSTEETEANGNISVILDDAIITISKTKNIIKTYIAGYNGSIKEHIYDEDYNINIKFTIASERPMIYNKDKVIKTLENFKKPDEVFISNQYLNELFDITEINITDWSMSQSEQFSNFIEVSLNAISSSGLIPFAY